MQIHIVTIGFSGVRTLPHCSGESSENTGRSTCLAGTETFWYVEIYVNGFSYGLPGSSLVGITPLCSKLIIYH